MLQFGTLSQLENDRTSKKACSSSTKELRSCISEHKRCIGSRQKFFPTLLCGVLVFFAAPPRSSSSFRVPPSSSLTHNNISHNNITHTTSHTQRLAHNITHTTSLTQHPTHNITHTTSHTQHLSHNISHNNITHTTSHTQRLAHAQHFVNLHVQISWQAQHVLCEPPCADLVAGTALREPSCADFVAGTALCEPPCALCAALAACPGVGCTPWRWLGSGALLVAFACCVRRLLLAKGSDVRPGVGWAPALDVQISWQAQYFVNLGVQIL